MFVPGSGGREGIHGAAVPEHGLAGFPVGLSWGLSEISSPRQVRCSIWLVLLCFLKCSGPAVPRVLVVSGQIPRIKSSPPRAGASLSAGGSGPGEEGEEEDVAPVLRRCPGQVRLPPGMSPPLPGWVPALISHGPERLSPAICSPGHLIAGISCLRSPSWSGRGARALRGPRLVIAAKEVLAQTRVVSPRGPAVQPVPLGVGKWSHGGC